MAVLKELQQQLETQAAALSKIQKDIAKNHQVRRQYTIQHGENEMVQKELELLEEEANVFKLIGPVLVKQDLAEAKANVNKRIEYISAELRRMDGTLKTLEEQQNAKREEVLKLQQRIQQLKLERLGPRMNCNRDELSDVSPIPRCTCSPLLSMKLVPSTLSTDCTKSRGRSRLGTACILKVFSLLCLSILKQED